MTVNDNRVVFPIGHLVGSLGVPAGTVRVGDRFHDLDPATDLSLWGLAHGDVSQVDTRPWTVADVLSTADLVGFADPAAGVARLTAAGLLVAVRPDGSDAARFARGYRLTPLQVGAGAGVDQPDRFRLAYQLGGLPRTSLPEDLYAVWRYAPLTSSLWQLAVDFSRQALAAGIGADEASPEAVLRDLLSMLHLLLSQAAGYLDLARH